MGVELLTLEEEEQELGRGRSGIVVKSRAPNGNILAVKRFSDESLARKVNYVLLGAPNPCSWNEDAVWSAHYRREILKELTSFWFPDKLRVARSYGAEWDDQYKTFKLNTEFVEGRPAALRHPFSNGQPDELSDLVQNVMEPLQDRLEESGFEGLVWQAGKGNPVAANNFLIEDNGDRLKWAWIDLESGVPALFPLNLKYLFNYYLPKSIKHKGPLFDDVDIRKLADYLLVHNEQLSLGLGEKRFEALADTVRMLDFHQKRWKSLNRAESGIKYKQKTGKITDDQAEFYRNHQSSWLLREGARAGIKAWNKILGEIPWKIFCKVTEVDYKQAAANTLKFAGSNKYRVELTHDYVIRRIESWEDRGIISESDAARLKLELVPALNNSDFIDFGIQLIGLKPMAAAVEGWCAAKFFFDDSLYSKIGSVALVVFGGPAVRTAYTSLRMGMRAVKKEEQPFAAFGAGMIPLLGNLAYPVQMVYSSAKKSAIGEFIIYDAVTKLGENAPIYGGCDTRTEHFFNKLAGKAVDYIKRNK